jgi:hypothetical protein
MIHKIILGVFMTAAYVLGVTTGMLMEKDHQHVEEVLMKYNMFRSFK